MTRPARTTCFGGIVSMGRLATLAVLSGAVVGCSHWDSYLDPSVVGAWEKTPTKVPILNRIATIEDEPDQYVQYSDIRPGDLIPESEPYRLGAGDQLIVTVYDLIVPNQPTVEQRGIDQLGYLEFPQLGRIYLSGLTEEQARQRIAERASEFVDEPLVSVSLQSRRQQAYHLMGNVRAPGPYGIPATDYRLLEALIAAGGISESSKYVHVIRQVPLTQETSGPSGPPEPDGGPKPAPSGEELLDIIDDLSGGGSGALPTRPAEVLLQPEEGAQPAGEPEPRQPMIDLLDPSDRRPNVAVPIEGSGSPESPTVGGTRWVFLNGNWVRAASGADSGVRGSGSARVNPMAAMEGLMTQRVIRIRTEPLLAGDARYNIVIRPGDVIRVPVPEAGNVYIDGEVARPGVFTLPNTGRLTLQRAITAAGGLGGLAIPERVDLTRIVGEDQQATIMLDLRAIAQGTQPDVYLKPDDRINVGTNFWAYPLAVIRNGFRTSYGFGFLLDRNFGNDVFGPPPTNRLGF